MQPCECSVLFALFSTYGYNVKWSNLDPLDVIQLLGNFGRDGLRVQNEFENLLKRVCFHRWCYSSDNSAKSRTVL